MQFLTGSMYIRCVLVKGTYRFGHTYIPCTRVFMHLSVPISVHALLIMLHVCMSVCVEIRICTYSICCAHVQHTYVQYIPM